MTNRSNEVLGSPWHKGEIAIQQSVGAVPYMDRIGRQYIRNFLLEQHRAFFPLLEFVVIGAVDVEDRPWATIRAGNSGFLHSPDASTLTVRSTRDFSDPAEAGMDHGQSVGLLGIDLLTRRRNRLNGEIRRTNAASFDVTVTQSFGNCPRYIQNRSLKFVRDPAQASAEAKIDLSELDARAQELITHADTFFVASFFDKEDGTRQVDVSHRGGRPGFVRIADGLLTIPDFSGNLHFMTLGNLLVNPKAGLLFLNSNTGDMLQLSGEANVVLSSPEIAAFDGAERLWTFKPRRIVYRPDGLPLRWQFEPQGWSKNLEFTGTWDDVRDRMYATQLSQAWRAFRVSEIVQECANVKSLSLVPTDDVATIRPLAGQHLPLRIAGPDGTLLVRNYSISTAPVDERYRISVRAHGAVSHYLHSLSVGAIVEVRAPSGGFTLDANVVRPLVLLAAGIGVTPILAMIHHLAFEARRTGRMRPTWLFTSARSLQDRPFDAELAELAEACGAAFRIIRVLSEPAEAVLGRDYERAGRIDIELLKAMLPFDDYDFYLCGPTTFMQSIYDGLHGLNVADERIHAETFGPSSFRRGNTELVHLGPDAVSNVAVQVIFSVTGKEALWQPGDRSLLEFAEARGLSPAFGCRAGSCGTCRVRVLQGSIAYLSPPTYPVAAGEALICCAAPAEEENRALHLDI